MAKNPKWERKRLYSSQSKAQKRLVKWLWRHPDKWTDYPMVAIGDVSGKEAPIRKVKIVKNVRDPWVVISFDGVETETKLGYIYPSPRRFKCHPLYKY